MIKKNAKRILFTVIALTFIFLGILGLFLPILQGVLFIIIGLAILAIEFSYIDIFIVNQLKENEKGRVLYKKIKDITEKYIK